MPLNQIAITLDDVNLKPANTEFLKQHVWSRYGDQLSKLQQVVVGFMSDFTKHPTIKIGYTALTGDQYTTEHFNMRIGSFEPVQVAVLSGQQINYTAPHEANDRDAVFSKFDEMAARFKGVYYADGHAELISQSLFHTVRPLLGSIMSATQDVSIMVGLDRNPWGDQFEMLVFCHEDTDFQSGIRILIRSPRIEAGEI